MTRHWRQRSRPLACTSKVIRIRQPRLWLLRPHLLLLLLPGLCAVAWASPRFLTATTWEPLGARRIGMTWIAAAVASAICWLIATGYHRRSMVRRAGLGLVGGPTSTLVVLFAVIVLPPQLALRAVGRVNLGLRDPGALLADMRALGYTHVADDGSEQLGNSYFVTADYSTLTGRSQEALCIVLRNDPDGFATAAMWYMPAENARPLRQEISAILERCGDPKQIRSDNDFWFAGQNWLKDIHQRLDTIHDAQRPTWRNFDLAGFSIAVAVVLMLIFTAIVELGLASSLRAAIVGFVVFVVVHGRNAMDATEDRMARWSTSVAVASVVALIVGLAVLLSRRIARSVASAQLAAACMMIPAVGAVILLDLEPTGGPTGAGRSCELLGIDLPLPADLAERGLLWIAGVALVASPLVGWGFERYRRTPRRR